MTDLSDQLRTLIEAAAGPVHPAEVSGPRPLFRDTAARRSRRPLATALAGVAAVALALLGVAALTNDDKADETTTTAMTGPSDADPTSCYPNPCRDVDDDEASALLGVPVAMPSGIPVGWELVSSEVEFYPAGVEVNGQPPSSVDSVLLRRNWSPPGESWTDGCPTSISLRAISRRPGDPKAGPRSSTYLALPDGTPIYGTVAPGVCGDGAGEQAEIGSLTWTHAGVEYVLHSFGAPPEALRSIVTSLP
jgi:hypothetical protein